MPLHTFTATVKGEDRYLHTRLSQGGTLIVVADGHGGPSCASAALASIENALYTDDAAAQLSGAGEAWQSTATRLLRDAVACAAYDTESESSGAVLTATLVSPAVDMLAWAQLGDTVAMWRDENGETQRTPEHNCRSNVAEREAAEKRGGHYVGGYVMAPGGFGGLQPTRSLGDRHMGPVASKEPELGSSPLGGALLVSSDGLITGAQSSAASDNAVFQHVLEQAEAGEDVEATVGALFPLGFLDDMTVLVLVPEDAN